jgi:hypothetical protein
MMKKGLGETEMFVQTIEGVRFLVHCTRDSQYVTKIMSTHGLLEEIQDHPPGGLSMESGRLSNMRSHSVVTIMQSTG